MDMRQLSLDEARESQFMGSISVQRIAQAVEQACFIVDKVFKKNYSFIPIIFHFYGSSYLLILVSKKHLNWRFLLAVSSKMNDHVVFYRRARHRFL